MSNLEPEQVKQAEWGPNTPEKAPEYYENKGENAQY